MLRKSKDRGHIVEGLMVAIANIDEIIKIIKKSKDPKIAAQELIKKKWKAGPVEAILKRLEKMHASQRELQRVLD